MQTHQAKRVAIIIEKPVRRRLTEALDQAGVTGYSILPVIGGTGRSGPWSADEAVGIAGGMVQVVCIIRPDRLDALLEGIFGVVERHIGVVTVSDCEVLRAERF
ncbi:MAG: transcriptional regulator [Pseudomonadota bacterium]